MPNKFVINKWWMIGFIAVIVILLMTLKCTRSTEIKMTLNAWESVHQWRVEGECADCHSKQEHVEQAVDFSTTLPIPAAKTHTEQFRRFTHGKDEKLASYSCKSCHEPDSCQTCHAILPESHAGDFVEPTGHSAGSLLHALLAKTNTTSCLSCHRSFIESCTGCHAAQEVMPWQKDAEKPLSRWDEMLNMK